MLRLDMPQAAAGSVHMYGAQALPGHRLFFLVSLLASFFSVVCCSLDVRAAYTAVYDPYSFQSATFLLLVPSLPTTCCRGRVRRPRGMCLRLPCCAAFSHISPNAHRRCYILFPALGTHSAHICKANTIFMSPCVRLHFAKTCSPPSEVTSLTYVKLTQFSSFVFVL